MSLLMDKKFIKERQEKSHSLRFKVHTMLCDQKDRNSKALIKFHETGDADGLQKANEEDVKIRCMAAKEIYDDVEEMMVNAYYAGDTHGRNMGFAIGLASAVLGVIFGGFIADKVINKD